MSEQPRRHLERFDPFEACLYCEEPYEHFRAGPGGGASRNVTCNRCGARYNLVIIIGQAVRGDTGEAIGRPGQPLFEQVLSGPSSKQRGSSANDHDR